MKAWNDGLYDDTTDQLAAFTTTRATPPAKLSISTTPVTGDPSKPHCAKCFELVKRIYNNHTAATCTRKPRSDSQTRKPSPTRKRELKANIATTELTAKEILAKRQLCYDQIEGGAQVEPGFRKFDCYAFINLHFPDEIEK